MLDHLENMFKEVRSFLLKDGIKMNRILGKNPKGDVTKEFDLRAEEIVVEYCKKNSLPVEIVSEESGTIKITDAPEYKFILDPVDGSNNFSRGVEFVGFSVAVLKQGPIILDNVKFGLVGNVFTGTVYKAEKGKGSYSNNGTIKSSSENVLSRSSLAIAIEPDITKKQKIDRVIPLMKKSNHIRRGGSVALEISNVASGGYDGFVDVIDKCTPENFFAAYLILKEAGGVFTDASGKEIVKEELDMATGYNVVASGNKELHRQILDSLDMNGN
jgi:myo-inositol-1(or 4)-monophosphatase